MPELPKTAEVAIIGGGMVGLSLALLLGRSNPDRQLLVLESRPWEAADAGVRTASGIDARSTALSPSSREIFQQAGVWESMRPAAAPITGIQVSDRGHPGIARMEAHETGAEALGYVIENHVLGEVLITALARLDNVQLLAPAVVEQLQPEPDAMLLRIAGRECRVTLAVVADGAGSRLLGQCGIRTKSRNYDQQALITNIALRSPHRGIAYERFTDQGPLALLPLPDAGREHRAALVWTMAPDRAAALAGLEESSFLRQLQDCFGLRAGRFLRSGVRHLYPLRLLLAAEQVRQHLVVIGNAAHFLHPVAGQGFNLALRDVARLAAQLGYAWRSGNSPGDLAQLQQYLQAQQRDQDRTIYFSDRLPGLFANRHFPVVAGRNLGLIALDLVPGLRRHFARFGAGLANAAVNLQS